MEKATDIQFEFVKSPFFKKGSLTFSSSGHYLRESDKHYRCDLSCRKLCDKNEPQIKKVDMERNFSRYAQKFVLPKSEKTFQFADGLMKQLFHGIIDGEDWGEMMYRDEYLDLTFDAMKADIKQEGTFPKSDIDEIERTFTKNIAINNRTLLISTLLCFFKSISEPENEAHLGRDLANICKKIYLSDTGKIQSILLERWGWYILNYINKKFPEYFAILEANGVKILNTNDPILFLELKEAVAQFEETDNFNHALNSQSTKVFYSLFSMIKNIIDPIIGGKSNEEQMKAIVKSMELMVSPKFEALMKVFQLSNANIRRKKNRRA